MARRRKTDSTTTTTQQPREKGNYISDEAMNALWSGNYGKLTGRQAQYRTSQEQTQQAKSLPVLEGMNTTSPEWESSLGRAKQWQNNIADEAKKYQYNETAARYNTLDKKDQGYLQRLVDRFGDGDLVRSSLDSKKDEWEQKYGKSIDQIYNDFLNDQDNAKIRQGEAHPILSTISSTLGSTLSPMTTLPSLAANIIAPDSEVAKTLEKTRADYSKQRKQLRAGVKENLGDTGDKIYDTTRDIADRMVRNTAGNILGGKLGGALITGLGDADEQMDQLNLRPGMSNRRKALTALGHGTVEGAGTAITMNALKGIPEAKGLIGNAKNIGAGAFNGALENSVAELIERAGDYYLNDDASEKDAEDQALTDQLKALGYSAGTGAVFGGLTKGLGDAAERRMKNKANIEVEPKQRTSSLDKPMEVPAVKNTDVEVPDTAKVEVNKAPVEAPEVSEKLKTPVGKPADPNDVAKRYAQAMSDYDNGKGYFDDDDLKNMSDELADDIAKGNDLTKHIETLEENIEDADNPEVAARMQSLVDELNDIQNGKITEPDVKTEAPKITEDTVKTPEVPNVKNAEIEQPEVPNIRPEEPEIRAEYPADDQKVRSFSKRGAADETLPDEIRDDLSGDYYNIVHNKDVSARADALFDEKNLTQTRSNLDRAVKDHDPASALLSYKLAKAYVDNGDFDAATDVLENVSAELTRMGQFTQAAKLAMLQNDPMAALRSYMRDLDKLNQWGSKKYKGKWNKLALTEQDIADFNKIKKGDKDALNAFVDQLNERFGKEIPANWWDKAVAASKTAMLLNLRTQGRNIVANSAMLPVRSMSDRVSALGQNVAHLINPDIKVTQSLVGGTAEQKNIAKQIFASMKDSILGENKMKDSVKSDILSKRQIFNDDFLGRFINEKSHGGLEKLNQKLGGNANKSTLETLQNFTYWLMGDFGDTPFVEKNFVNRLASYMKAQGINNIDDVPDDAINIAIEEALKATFKDDNNFSKALQGVKQKSGKFGEIALPFVKTPANLAMRAVDYSPAGIINTIRKAKNGADASRVIDELSKNLTGTAMVYLGYKLREKGLLSGNYSDNDEEKAWQKQHGMLENALHLGKNYYTIDWAQPAVTPMILGSVLRDAFKTSDEENANILDGINSVGKAGLTVANSWLQTSPLQSLTDIWGGNSYSSGGVAENIANEIIEFPQRFIPAQLGAIARTTDPVIRDTYIKDNSLTGVLGNQVRSTMAKVPGLSKTLPASYDTWGNERTRSDTKGEAFFAQNLNPGQLGNENSTPLDAEIQRIYDETGNSKVFPLNADRSLKYNNETHILTNKQHSEYQRTMGQRSYKLAEGIMNSAAFKNLSDDEKAAVLGKAYELSNTITKEDMFPDYSNNDNKALKEAYRTGGEQAAVKYLLDEATAKKLGVNTSTYMKKEAETPGGGLQYANDKQAAEQLGIVDKDGDANVESYQKIMAAAGDQAQRVQNDIPTLAGMGFDRSAYYTYANAVNEIPSLTIQEFAEDYNGINTNPNNKITEKELLDYINSFDYDDPSEAEDLWYAYGKWEKKDGTRKKLKWNGKKFVSYY